MLAEIILYFLLLIAAICFVLERNENNKKDQLIVEMTVAIAIMEEVLKDKDTENHEQFKTELFDVLNKFE